MIDEITIISFLKDKKTEYRSFQLVTAEIRKQIEQVKEHRQEIEKEIIETTQMAVNYGKVGGSSGKHQDLGDILFQTYEQLTKEIDDLVTKYKQAQKEIEIYHRLNLIYQTLDSETKMYLEKIYVNEEKIESVAASMDISPRTLIRKKNRVLKNMVEMFNSTMSNKSIAKIKSIDEALIRDEKKPYKKIMLDGQITFEDFT